MSAVASLSLVDCEYGVSGTGDVDLAGLSLRTRLKAPPRRGNRDSRHVAVGHVSLRYHLVMV